MTPNQFAKLWHQLQKDEAAMRRAFRKYDKQRAIVARAAKALEKQPAGDRIGGEHDELELAEAMGVKLNREHIGRPARRKGTRRARR